MITFTTICGVPINYDRDSRADYGTRGRPIKKGGPVTPDFFAALEAWMIRLCKLPWGKPELLVTGGIRGAGTDPNNRHTQGRAIDIDAIYWPGKPPLVTLQAEKTPRVYLAVEATLRRHFGTVLDFWYNDAHKDHWHVDDGHPVAGWKPTRAHVVFLQAALNYVWDTQPALVVDGNFGPKTEAAAKAVEVTLPSSPSDMSGGWVPFLEETASRGFALATI